MVTFPAAAQSGAACVNGEADGFPCNNIDIVSRMPLEAIGGDPENGVFGNDNWAWVSPETGRMYVMFGLRDGTSFIEVTDPEAPVYLGKLPSHESGLSDYRDIKVYNNYAFIVGDVPYTAHGMQIFDLTKLDAMDVNVAPATFSADSHYDGVGFGHNMWINEATGYAYIFRSDKCDAGTHMVDIRDPLNPVKAGAGCFNVDGADSDAECLIYDGPDTDYVGQELCFVGSDMTVGIADVTDKDNPVVISNFAYPDIRRAHQGVLTPDHKYWLISDTMDEAMLGYNTRTIIIDVTDLDNPEFVRVHTQETTARDHNVYIKDGLAIQSNWRAGLRVLDITSDFENWQEIAYLDTYPANDDVAVKSGAWSHYDWLPNNVIVVSDVESGLFLLRIRQDPTDVNLADFAGGAAPSTLLMTVGTLLALSAVSLLIWRKVQIRAASG